MLGETLFNLFTDFERIDIMVVLFLFRPASFAVSCTGMGSLVDVEMKAWCSPRMFDVVAASMNHVPVDHEHVAIGNEEVGAADVVVVFEPVLHVGTVWPHSQCHPLRCARHETEVRHVEFVGEVVSFGLTDAIIDALHLAVNVRVLHV